MVYIGKAKSLKDRIRLHFAALEANTHYNSKLQDQYNAHGKPEVITLEYCEDDEVFKKENMWIQEFNSTEEGLNIYGKNMCQEEDIHTLVPTNLPIDP